MWFSQHGNLLSTSKWFVDAADAGLTATELQPMLHVEVKEPLLQLYRQKRIERKKIEDLYVYLARDPGQQRSQRLRREGRQATWELGEPVTEAGVSAELKAAMVFRAAARHRMHTAFGPACPPGGPWVLHYLNKPIGNHLKGFHEACMRAGFSNLLSHDLRRSAIRNMERAAVPRKVAMEFSGHKTESVYRRYDIVSQQDMKLATAKMANYAKEQKSKAVYRRNYS